MTNVLREGPTDDINGSAGAAVKKFSMNFSNTNTKFDLSLHYNSSDFLINKFKTDKKKVSFPTQFCLGVLSNIFDVHESREFSSKVCNVCNFLANYNATGKSGILNIHKYLMVKNNIK